MQNAANPQVEALKGTPTDPDVLIIGAGPTGLTAANVLAQQGVKVRIVERDAGPIRESRALIVQGRSLELFDKLGLAAAAVRQGQPMDGVFIMVNGKSSGHIPIGGHENKTPYPLPLVLEQSKTQKLLLDGLAQRGVQVAWRTAFVGLAQDENGVTATLRRADGGEETVRSRYVIGADGAGSKVRGSVGLHLEGSTYPQSFFLADVDLDWLLGHDKLFLNITREHFFAFFPMYGGKRFRIIGSVTSALSQKDKLSLGEVEALLRGGGVDAVLSDARWITVYRVHKRMAGRFRAGRVFLAGDAGHVHSPAGGQGMNTGIGDAFNLAWKLAAVVKGEAQPDLLESYEEERLPVAERVLRVTDRNFDIEASTNPFMQRFRLVLAPLAAKVLSNVPGGKTFLFNYLSQLDIHYRGSPAVGEHLAEGNVKVARAGDRAPYGFVEADGARVSLFDLFRGTGFQVLLFEGSQPQPNFDRLCRDFLAAAEPFRVTLEPLTVRAGNAALEAAYDVNTPTAFLVRPDGHLGYRGPLADPEPFGAYLKAFFLEPLTTPNADARLEPLPAEIGA